jgi:hypothetical protein
MAKPRGKAPKGTGINAAIITGTLKGKGPGVMAEELGLGRSTIHRRLQDPEVRAAVANFRANCMAGPLGQAIERTLLAMVEDVLRRIEGATQAEAEKLQDRLFQLIDRMEQNGTPAPVQPNIHQPPPGQVVDVPVQRTVVATTTLLREALLKAEQREKSPEGLTQ